MKGIKKYSTYRISLESGDMLEWRSKSLLGSIIRFFTKKNVNHTSSCLSLAKQLGFKEIRNFIIEADKTGIVLHLLSRELKNYKGQVYWYRLKPKYQKFRKAFTNQALSLIGIKYDYGSLVKNASAKVSADLKKLFCSEFHFFNLVGSGILPQYKIKNKQVVCAKSNKPIAAPQPGNFEQFKIYLKPIRIF